MPAELSVTKTADTNDGACTLDDCSLREAILAANGRPGPDQIHVPAGVYELTLIGDDDLGAVGDLDITDDVTIRGDGGWSTGDTRTVLDGIGEDRILEIHAGATVEIRDLQVRNGYAYSSGGILNSGDLTLIDVEVVQNRAVLRGGGIGNGGVLHLRHTFVLGNESDDAGGGIYNYFDSQAWIEGDTLVGFNRAAVYGGGVYTLSGGTVYVVGSRIAGNSAVTGAGLFVGDGAGAEIEDAEFSDNDGSARGGAIYSEGVVDVRNTRFEGNDAYDGGALASNAGDLGDGAVIYGATFVGNQGYSSAIKANGAIRLNESLVAANRGHAAVVIDRWEGEGCALDEAVLENVTLSGNLPWPWPGTEPVSAVGTGCALDLRFSTIAGHAGHGIRVSTFYAAHSPELEGVLLADNSAGNCSGGVTSRGANLTTDTTCGLSHPTDLVGLDAGIDALADNGGGTLTHALASDSPALDGAAAADCPPVDQRLVTRPQGPACDIGAFESASPGMPRLAPSPAAPPTPTSGAPTAEINENANCRSGPGTVYTVVGFVAAGSRSPIVGRDVGGRWWVIDLGAQVCWVTADAVSASGDLTAVPVRPAPPTPTPTPSRTPTPTPTFALIVSVVPLPSPTAIP